MDEFVIQFSQFKELSTWHFKPFSFEVREAKTRLGQLPYEVVKLGDVAQIIRGYSKVNRSLEEGVPIITAQNIAEADFSFEDHSSFVTDEEHIKRARSAIETNDVLLNLYVKTNTNLAAVYDGNKPANLPSNIAKIMVDQAKISPHYLVQFLNSSTGKAILEQYAVGTVRASLTLKALIDEVSIPLPPLEIQEKIVARYLERRSRARALRQEADELLDLADDIFWTE